MGCRMVTVIKMISTVENRPACVAAAKLDSDRVILGVLMTQAAGVHRRDSVKKQCPYILGMSESLDAERRPFTIVTSDPWREKGRARARLQPAEALGTNSCKKMTEHLVTSTYGRVCLPVKMESVQLPQG
jgi:hypothetical protein